jgi:hypothetical protein
MRSSQRAFKIDRTRGMEAVVEIVPPDQRRPQTQGTLPGRGPDHVDCVTALDVVLTASNEPMLITGARDGTVKVWK